MSLLLERMPTIYGVCQHNFILLFIYSYQAFKQRKFWKKVIGFSGYFFAVPDQTTDHQVEQAFKNLLNIFGETPGGPANGSQFKLLKGTCFFTVNLERTLFQALLGWTNVAGKVIKLEDVTVSQPVHIEKTNEYCLHQPLNAYALNLLPKFRRNASFFRIFVDIWVLTLIESNFLWIPALELVN